MFENAFDEPMIQNLFAALAIFTIFLVAIACILGIKREQRINPTRAHLPRPRSLRYEDFKKVRVRQPKPN